MNRRTSFQNAGLIDPRCITTIGVSVKETENPIGFFGTGLKYAIAIILRTGGSITIWRGLEELTFDSVPVDVRGRTVDVVRMNGQELGFTTDLGKHWEVWQAMRELYCNTKDENGRSVSGTLEAASGHTTIVVDHEGFAQCFSDLHLYILQGDPVQRAANVNFFSGDGRRSVYFRSIRVGEADRPHLFTPDVQTPITLTEDRTMKYSSEVAMAIARAVLQCEDERFIEQWLTAGADFAEYSVDLDWSHITPSAQFLKTARRVASDTSKPLNLTTLRVLARHSEVPDPVEARLLPTEADALKVAIAFCNDLTYTVDEYPIVVVESLGQNILGRADAITKRILIARRAIQMGDMTLASTLIEEWAHLKHGLADESRELQNWLFDQVVRLGRAYQHASRREAA